MKTIIGILKKIKQSIKFLSYSQVVFFFNRDLAFQILK